MRYSSEHQILLVFMKVKTAQYLLQTMFYKDNCRLLLKAVIQKYFYTGNFTNTSYFTPA